MPITPFIGVRISWLSWRGSPISPGLPLRHLPSPDAVLLRVFAPHELADLTAQGAQVVEHRFIALARFG